MIASTWIRRAGRRTVSVFITAALFCSLLGCSSTGGSPAGGDAASQPEVKSSASVAPRLSRDLLTQHGFEEVWYLPDVRTSGAPVGIQNAFLLEEGLFIVTLAGRGSEGARGGKALIRFDRRNGEAVWYEGVDLPLTSAPAAYIYPDGVDEDDELFFLQGDTVVALDLASGNRMWSRKLKIPVATGVCANQDAVFLGAANSRAFAVRKKEKVDLWTYFARDEIEATPIMSGERVIVASHDGFVRGLVPSIGWDNGRAWEFETNAAVRAPLVSFDRHIYVGSEDYKLYCLRQDGTVHWSFQAEAPVVDPPVLYHYRPNREFCFCIADRDLLGRSPRTLFAVPLPKGDSAAGVDEAWSVPGVRKVISIGHKHLYVLMEPTSANDRVLAAIDIETGKESFRLDLGGFNFVPANSADFGRNKHERSAIYLISESGAMQVIREKMK